MEKKHRRIDVRVTCAEHDRYTQAARLMGVTVSDTVRGALDDLAERALIQQLGK